MIDSRYTLNLEWCGYAKPRYVVRFCGDWIGQYESKTQALTAALKHNKERF